VATTQMGLRPAARSWLDGRLEGGPGAYGIRRRWDDPDVPASNAQRDGILRDGGVRLVGGVDHQGRAGCRSRGSRDRPSRAPPRWRAGCSPRRCRRSRRRTRRAGPSTGAAIPGLTCSSSGGSRRKSSQWMALVSERRGEHFGEDGGSRNWRWKVGHEAGMVPQRGGGDDQLAEVLEDDVEALALLRPGGGQGVDQFAGLDFRQNRIVSGVSRGSSATQSTTSWPVRRKIVNIPRRSSGTEQLQRSQF